MAPSAPRRRRADAAPAEESRQGADVGDLALTAYCKPSFNGKFQPGDSKVALLERSACFSPRPACDLTNHHNRRVLTPLSSLVPSPSSVPSILVTSDVCQDVVHQYASGELIQDKYRLTKPLGRGGMGAVWQARNLALDSDVAIKIILNDGRQAQLADRLVREARASARLNHPGIVRVFDVGQTPHGDAYLVMELLRGTSLADRLVSDGRLAAVRAVQLFLPLAEALESAHASGIIHRDLKPDNIFLAETSGHLRPKVLDFGVAMDLNLDAHRITQAGTLLGSPAYMSPEQARGDVTLDHRTDIWSFCVSLYETLTAETPFGDDGNYYVLLDRIVKAPPTPTTDHGAGDQVLWQILARGLQKHADARWPSMHSLGVALAMWLESHDVAEDILGQGLQSTWLAPDSDGRGGSLTDLPPASARISGALRRTADRPSGGPSAVAGLTSGQLPGEGVFSAAHTTLASTLRPPTSTPAGRRRWLFAGVLLAAMFGVVVLGFGVSISGPRASPNAGAPGALPAPEQEPEVEHDPAGPDPAPSAAGAPSGVTPRQDTTAQPSKQLSAGSRAAAAPRARSSQDPSRAQGLPAAPSTKPPQPANPKPPNPKPVKPKPSKPKLGDDLGF